MSDWNAAAGGVAGALRGLRESTAEREEKKRIADEDARRKAQWEFEMAQAKEEGERARKQFAMNTELYGRETEKYKRDKAQWALEDYVTAHGTTEGFYKTPQGQDYAMLTGMQIAPETTTTISPNIERQATFKGYNTVGDALQGNPALEDFRSLLPYLEPGNTPNQPELIRKLRSVYAALGGTEGGANYGKSTPALKALNDLRGKFETGVPRETQTVAPFVPPEGFRAEGGYQIPVSLQERLSRTQVASGELASLAGVLELIGTTPWENLPKGMVEYAAGMISKNTGSTITSDQLGQAAWAAKNSETFGKPAELLGTMQALGMFYASGAGDMADRVAKESGLTDADIAMVRKNPMVWAMMGQFGQSEDYGTSEGGSIGLGAEGKYGAYSGEGSGGKTVAEISGDYVAGLEEALGRKIRISSTVRPYGENKSSLHPKGGAFDIVPGDGGQFTRNDIAIMRDFASSWGLKIWEEFDKSTGGPDFSGYNVHMTAIDPKHFGYPGAFGIAGLTPEMKQSIGRGKAIDEMFNKKGGIAYSPGGGTQMYDVYAYIEGTVPPAFVEQAKKDWEHFKYGYAPDESSTAANPTAEGDVDAEIARQNSLGGDAWWNQ